MSSNRAPKSGFAAEAQRKVSTQPTKNKKTKQPSKQIAKKQLFGYAWGLCVSEFGAALTLFGHLTPSFICWV